MAKGLPRFCSETRAQARDHRRPDATPPTKITGVAKGAIKSVAGDMSVAQNSLPSPTPSDHSASTDSNVPSNQTRFDNLSILRITQALTCAICMDPFVIPYTLAPCAHKFCFSCLKQALTYSRKASQRRSCPNCRSPLEQAPMRDSLVQQLAETVYCDEQRERFEAEKMQLDAWVRIHNGEECRAWRSLWKA